MNKQNKNLLDPGSYNVLYGYRANMRIIITVILGNSLVLKSLEKKFYILFIPLIKTCYIALTYTKHKLLIHEHVNIKMKQNLCAINILLLIFQGPFINEKVGLRKFK